MHAPAERRQGIPRHAAERRQPAQREIQLRHTAGAAVVPDPCPEIRLEFDGIDQPQEGLPRIGARDDGRCEDFRAIGERDACDRAVLHEDAHYVRARADVGPRLPRRLRHGTRDRSGPPDRRHAASARHRIDRGPEQQDGAGARRPRPHRGAVNRPGGDARLEEIGFKPFGHQIRDRHRAPAQQRERLALAERPELAARLQQLPHVARRRCVDRRRCHLEELRQEPANPGERRAELRIARRVLRGERPDRVRGAAWIGREHQRPPVRRYRDQSRIRMHKRHSATLELHVAHDRRPQRSKRVCERRAPITRRELLARGAAADDMPALEDKRFPAGFGEIESRDQSVMARADDDGVGHGYFFAVSLMMRMAAFRPGAPMMPPPGCVAEPHM